VAVARKASNPLSQPLTVSRLWRIAALAGGFISGLYVVYTAWTGFGWWQPAGVAYVDMHIESAVKPIVTKVDDQGISILSGRIETLKGSKQLQVDAKSRLELQSHTTKDPIALQIIAGQQKSIDETIKGIDDQIATLSAQLQTHMKR
jgi:hypothetical protein